MTPAEKTLISEVTTPLKRAIVGLIAFSAAINILMLASPIFMYQIYDRVLPTRHVDTLLALCLLMLLAMLVLAVLEATRCVACLQQGKLT
ncbi:MAG: hypothetical protein AB7K04_11995 [Pseudorhodoplanes sp.]